jgi:hypothetical protein
MDRNEKSHPDAEVMPYGALRLPLRALTYCIRICKIVNDDPSVLVGQKHELFTKSHQN